MHFKNCFPKLKKKGKNNIGIIHSKGACVVGRGRPPYRPPKAGSCLTLRKEFSEETHADKVRDFIGKGTREESSRVREPRRRALHVACRLGFYGDGISFRVVFGQSF